MKPQSKINNKLLRIGVFLAFGFFGSPSSAEDIKNIVFIVDASDSVDYSEYMLQKQAYVNLFQSEAVAEELHGAYIAIIEFAYEAKVVVPWTNNLEFAALTYNQARRISSGTSSTNPLRALILASAMLENRPGERIIDIAGDGAMNSGQEQTPAVWLANSSGQLDRLRITANALVFGSEFERSLAVPFYQLHVNGFVMEVDEIADFEIALKRKILMEISQSNSPNPKYAQQGSPQGHQQAAALIR